jgi:hypothetical protein
MNNVESDDKTDTKAYLTVPYIRSIFRDFSSIANYSLKIACSIPNNLKQFIKMGKDELEIFSLRVGISDLLSRDCNASYVGQTKRQLSTRIRNIKWISLGGITPRL